MEPVSGQRIWQLFAVSQGKSQLQFFVSKIPDCGQLMVHVTSALQPSQNGQETKDAESLAEQVYT